jgi:nucleoside 2-deoxyribosyltransferase
MKFYLAAAFNRKNEIAEKTKELQALGHVVTSTWPWEDSKPEATLADIDEESLIRKIAYKDLREIREADAVILFTQEPTEPMLRGGRMHEFGYAHALGKTLIVCGPRENIFHYIDKVWVYDNWQSLSSHASLAHLEVAL